MNAPANLAVLLPRRVHDARRAAARAALADALAVIAALPAAGVAPQRHDTDPRGCRALAALRHPAPDATGGEHGPG